MSTMLAQSLARTLGVTTSLESVDVDINIGSDAVLDEDGAPVSPVAPLSDEPVAEAQEASLAEDESDVDEVSDAMDDADADIETLESIQIQLERSLEHGGLDTPSFEMMNITMKHIYSKYGINHTDVMPSLESFQEDRELQTRISMEKNGFSLKSMGKAVGEMLAKLWFRIKNFVLNAVKLNYTLDKRITAVMNAAKDKDLASVKPTGKIKVYSAKKLVMNGKLANPSTIISQLKLTSKHASTYATAADSCFGKFTQALANWRADSSEENGKAAVEALTKIVSAGEKLPFQDARIVSKEFGVRGEGKSIVPGLKLEKKPTPEGMSTEGEVMSAAQIQDLMSTVLEFNKSLKGMGEHMKRKDLEAKIVEMSKVAGESSTEVKGDEKAEKKVEKIRAKTISDMLKMVLKFHAAMVSYYIGVNKAALDYAAQSLQALRKEAKGGKKEDDA